MNLDSLRQLAHGRPLVIPDTETTGVEPDSRIVEIGFTILKPNGADVEWRSLVDPEMPIPQDATDVHGITDLHVTFGCRQCGMLTGDHPVAAGESPLWPEACDEWKRCWTFKELASRLADGFSNVDFAGKNVRFDLERLTYEFDLAGVLWSYAGARIVCIDRLEHLGEPRDLSNLYRRRLGKEPTGAHSALGDVRMSAEILSAQLERFGFPLNIAELHERQWPGYIDAEGKFRFNKHGVPICAFGKKYKNWDMRKIPRSFWDWMLREKFPLEAKSIAQAARDGKFPEKKEDG